MHKMNVIAVLPVNWYSLITKWFSLRQILSNICLETCEAFCHLAFWRKCVCELTFNEWNELLSLSIEKQLSYWQTEAFLRKCQENDIHLQQITALWASLMAESHHFPWEMKFCSWPARICWKMKDYSVYVPGVLKMKIECPQSHLNLRCVFSI